ncbi:phage protein NinX family protein [Cronobacter dublinensis]
MDYSKLSDFEINLKVAHIILGSGNYDWNSENKEIYSAGIDGAEFLPNGYFDPCNNPADAWPIITEHHIAVVPYRHTLPQAWPTAFGVVSKFTTEDKNPLRAAMIVFLMMQEGQDA